MTGRQNPCPVPGCPRNVSITSKFGVCAIHTEQFEGITYYLHQAQKEMNQKMKQAKMKGVRLGDKITPSGLILPG